MPTVVQNLSTSEDEKLFTRAMWNQGTLELHGQPKTERRIRSDPGRNDPDCACRLRATKTFWWDAYVNAFVITRMMSTRTCREWMSPAECVPGGSTPNLSCL